MKINRQNFAAALSEAAAVLSKKPVQPTLANVLARAGNDGLTIIASDLRTTFSTFVECSSSADFCADAQDLIGFVNALDGETVSIAIDDSRKLTISGGGAKFSMPSDRPEDYPSVPLFDNSKAVEVDAAALSAALDGTWYAASVDKLHLSGVLFSAQGRGKVEAMATDGHRMSVVKLALDLGKAKSCIIPAGPARVIGKLLAGAEKCLMRIDGNLVQVQVGASVISAQLLEATPLTYEQFVAKSAWSDSPAVANRSVVLAAIKRALVVRGSKDAGRTGELTLTVDKLRIRRETTDKTSEETITVDGGTEQIVTCNLRYLQDAIENISGEDVELHVKGPEEPINIRSKSGDQMAVVMPTRP